MNDFRQSVVKKTGRVSGVAMKARQKTTRHRNGNLLTSINMRLAGGG